MQSPNALYTNEIESTKQVNAIKSQGIASDAPSYIAAKIYFMMEECLKMAVAGVKIPCCLTQLLKLLLLFDSITLLFDPIIEIIIVV